ncbi:MAG TPA: crosslink repair DNA glycosylase YcaQ family protein [Solirubrobacteraceae bacterium]|nr:crosslink repair DNA glycosylase YcaQ family protein [Solirubrobacteraceae bacterium]
MASRLTELAARRIALASQGFGRRRPSGPSGPSARQIMALIERIGLLQLDSVNVFARAHYMPVFSRLGPYDTAVLDRLAGHVNGPTPNPRTSRVNRRLVEYWAHEASLLPLRTHALMRWRMEEDGHWGSMERIAREQPELVADTLELVRERGPIRAGDTDFVRPDPRPGHMWNWHDGKIALEHLFSRGEVMAARRINFERIYDLSERVLPPEVRQAPTPAREDAQRELMRISARALGIATEPDLGDYFRLPRAESKLRVAELVAGGELIETEVRGWGAPAYLWHDAPRPRPIRGRALLSPFDPLIWFRQRVLRMFGFHYRIEIYVPAPKRVYGYYVLPFLLDDALVARVDLKSDRQAGALLVQGAFAEVNPAQPDGERVAAELAAELAVTARWLGLEGGVVVRPNGDLAPALASAVRAA